MSKPTCRPPSASTEKLRHSEIAIDFGGPQTISGMSAPNGRGELVFYDENGRPVAPKTVEVGLAYSRPKGPKVLTRAAADPVDILLSVNHLLPSYDWVFAVDTNTRTVGADIVCVTAITMLREISLEGPRWSARSFLQHALEVRNPRVPPERLGWRHALWAIEKSGLSGKIAMFVDSELSELRAINDGTQDLVPGYRLPHGVSLLYASSDAGARELIGNKAIRECDRYAGSILTRIEAGDAPPIAFRADMPAFCDRYRPWPQSDE